MFLLVEVIHFTAFPLVEPIPISESHSFLVDTIPFSGSQSFFVELLFVKTISFSESHFF